MGKKHFIGTAAAGAAALLLSVAGACTDDREERLSPGERIGFAVDLWQEGQTAQAARTKGADVAVGGMSADTLPAVRVITLKGEGSEDGKPLYLHAVTTDGVGEDGDTAGAGGGDAATAQNGGARTKAAPVDNATMYDEMAVTAFVYPAAQSWPAAYTGGSPSAALYMRGVKVKKSESWNTAYYWPGAARKISFFASAPYDSPGLTAFNDGTSGTPPYLSYTVPANVADQKDLLVAASTDRPGNTNTAEPLTMRHALTGMRFVTGDDMLPGTVSRITLKNVYGTGRLPLTASPAWYGHSDKKSFTQTLSPAAVAPDPQAPDTPLTPEAATFMMLPQTLPAGAQIEVRYRDNLTYTMRTLTADIAGSAWPMGKTVTYRISTSSISVTPTLTVTGPEDFEHTGGNKNYTVRSYVQVTRPGDPTTTNPVPWTAEFSEDGGGTWNATPPAWLTAFTASGAGDTGPTNHTASVAPQVNSAPADPHNEALRNAVPVSNYDLSTHDYQGNTAPMRTANCYIVNAPGSYRLPLVYGNAIDKVKVPGGPNPGWNTSAYTSTASGTNVLSPFINHLGAGITNPYIYNNANCQPASCTLVWQDEPNLVTNVVLSSDGHFLEFTVSQATIRQGNAVVAVRDASNTVMWSWHIWVTDYRPGTTGTTTPDKEITNYQNHRYKLMTVNLGWCYGKEKIYAERTVKVRFRQTGTSATETITVKQKAKTITEIGDNTYYQWGRKDPFVGAVEAIDGSRYSTNKTWYDASGATHTNENPPTDSFPSGQASIASGITQPNTFRITDYGDSEYTNLWSAYNTIFYPANDNPVVKTIYDPCPAGYKMPPSNAFTGFTTTGQNTNTSSQFNVQRPWNKGWNFYCNSRKTETVFIPAMGFRYTNSAVPEDVGRSGLYYTAGACNREYRWRLIFNYSFVYPLNYTYIYNYSFPVRAIQE